MNNLSPETTGEQHTLRPSESVLPSRGEPGVGMKPKPFPRAAKAQILVLSCALKDRCEVSNQVIVLESQEKLMNKSTPSIPAG